MDTAGTLTVHCAALPRKALRNEETERKERMNMDNTDNMNVNMDMQTGAEERPEPLTGADPGTLANAIAHFLDGKKARDIRIINIKNKTDICDYMVLATGTSSTHVQTLGGEVEYQMSRRCVEPLHVEGRDNRNWLVLDYAHVLVHVFTKDTREFYNLEKLYAD